MPLALIEHGGGRPSEPSLQALTLARSLAAALGRELACVLIGQGGRAAAPVLRAHGAARVHLIGEPCPEAFAPQAWARSLAQLVRALRPALVLAPGTDRAHELMAHLAAETDLPLAANCTEVDPGPPFRVIRWRWAGSLLEEALLEGQPPLLTVASHVFPAEPASAAGEAEVEVFAPTLADGDPGVQLKELVAAAADGVTLATARVVVSGGRGVGSQEGFAVLEELAGLLGAAVGASRVATNNGWRPHADQVGQTGTRIGPDLYIACGISGAIHHMVGCKGAKKILAINKDPEAPIMAKADYAVVGDLHQLLPALIEEIRRGRDA